jgi:hypothetical protein
MRSFHYYPHLTFFSFIAITLSTLVLPFGVSGQSISPIPTPKAGVNLTLSPVFMNLLVDAGKSVKRTFKITNNNDFVESYNIVVLKYISDNKGSIIPADLDKQDNTVKWFKFAKDTVSVAPKRTETIEFELTVPEDAFLGYYFGIALERAKDDFGARDTAKVVGAPTIPVLLEVRRQIGKDTVGADADPTKYKSGEIATFRTTSPWYEYLPAEFDIAFENTGKIHLVPFGEIFIGQGKDTEISSVSVNENGSNTLPGSTRTYKAFWDDGFIVREPVMENGKVKVDGKGNTVYKENIYWDKLTKFRIGRYTANVVLVYNNGQYDVPLEKQITFWVLPWKIIIITVIVISILLFGLRSLIMGIFRS